MSEEEPMPDDQSINEDQPMPDESSVPDEVDAVDDKSISVDEFKTRSRRSFVVAAAAATAGYVGFRKVQSRPLAGQTPDILREGLKLNESVWSALFRGDHPAPTFDYSESSVLRVNGGRGLDDEIDLDTWTLQVIGPDGDELGNLVLDDIKALQRHEMTIEHKCIEGWAQITTWAGARFSDLAAMYEIPRDTDIRYVSMSTPGGGYYVGLDMVSAMHPQSLLAYDMHGGPLDMAHGAPLRLAIPVKYGIKHIKRIGTIEFTNERPDDFWGERGYSWYAGL